MKACLCTTIATHARAFAHGGASGKAAKLCKFEYHILITIETLVQSEVSRDCF